MRTLAATLVVFLAAAAFAQAHVPASCIAEVRAATKATEELSTSRADKNDWFSDWMESHGRSMRAFTMEEFSQYLTLELRIANAQVSFDNAFDELFACIEGS